MLHHLRTLCLLLAAALFQIDVCAQGGAQPPASVATPRTDSVKAKKAWPLVDKTKGSRRTDGLFSLFQDTANGGVLLYIRKTQVGKEFIYQSFALSGPTSLLLNQSIYRSNFIFRIEKAFDRIELSRVNTAFYYD
ncbi:MAG: Matrixin, partial [Sphingobacteriales bacterium]